MKIKDQDNRIRTFVPGQFTQGREIIHVHFTSDIEEEISLLFEYILKSNQCVFTSYPIVSIHLPLAWI